jgi:hypothetical protein
MDEFLALVALTFLTIAAGALIYALAVVMVGG